MGVAARSQEKIGYEGRVNITDYGMKGWLSVRFAACQRKSGDEDDSPGYDADYLWVKIKKVGQEWDKMTGKEKGATA